MDKKSQKILIVLGVLSLNIVLIIAAVMLMNSIKQMLEEDTKINLIEIVNQNQEVITSKVLLDMNDLKLIAEKVAETYTDFSSEIVREFLAKKAWEKGHDLLIISDQYGNSYSNKGDEVDISGRIYYKKAMEGIPNISEKLVSRVSGENIFVCSVPIYRNNEIIGTIQKTYSEEVINELFTVSLFSNEGHIYVINGSGEIVIHTQHEKCERIGNSFYRMLYAYGNIEASKMIKKDLTAGNKGFVELHMQEQDLFSAYAPIEGVFDWYIISSVPSNIVSHNSAMVIKIFYIVLMVVFLIFISFSWLFMWYRRQNEMALEKMAFVDSLTGGNTYNKFILDAEEIFKKNTDLNYAIVKFDVDNFKYINEFYGYEKGDIILRAIYKTVCEKLGPDEILARISGDNFVFLKKYTDIELIKGILSFGDEIDIDSAVKINFTCSAGIYFIKNREESVSTMIDKASIASKTIKSDAKKQYAYYKENMREAMVEEENIKRSMEKALQNKEFVPYYQPKYNVYTSKIVGAEALVRWFKPDIGMIPPDKFISVLEKNGFIVELDMYIFEEVCKKIRNWIDSGIKPIPVSVNFSRVHLYDKNFIANVTEKIIRYQIPQKMIEIELTESAIFDNMDIIFNMSTELKKNGFVITMDDFGSGYSSLNMLKDIPIDVLKIDREFLKSNKDDGRREIIIELIVEMAKRLNIEVVSEGVELSEQVEFLKKIGCSIAQGYFYAKPMPSDAMDKIIIEGDRIVI